MTDRREQDERHESAGRRHLDDAGALPVSLHAVEPVRSRKQRGKAKLTVRTARAAQGDPAAAQGQKSTGNRPDAESTARPESTAVSEANATRGADDAAAPSTSENAKFANLLQIITCESFAS